MKTNKFFKNILPSTLSLLLCTTLTLSLPLSAFAAEETAGSTSKEENIYANLDNNGTVNGIYVVNAYNLTSGTKITDYGDYSSVRNLTSEDEITISDGKVTVDAPQGKFYYQGNTDSKELPWQIKISYLLDGKNITGNELAASSGTLEIQVHISKNPSVDEAFFDNYLLQATITLNTDKCSDIQAEGATVANNGKNKQILYNIMGGQEKNFTISANVSDFDMAPISFMGVPMSFDLDIEDMNTSTLTDKTVELKVGAAKLDNGAEDLLDGSEKMQNGLTEYATGIDTLYSGTAALTDGVDQLYTGVHSYTEGTEKIAGGIGTLSDKTKNLPELMSQLSSAIVQLNNGSSLLANDTNGAAAQITSGLNQINAGLLQMKGGLTVMNAEGIVPMLAGLDSMKTELVQFQLAIAGAQNYVTALSGISSEYSAEAEALKVIAAAGTITTFSSVSGNTISKENTAAYSTSASSAVSTQNQELAALYTRMTQNSMTLAAVLNGDGSSSNPGLSALVSSCSFGLGNFQSALFNDTPNNISLYTALQTLQTQLTGENGAINGVQTLIDGITQLKQSVNSDSQGSLKSSLKSLDNGISILKEKTSSLPDTGNQLTTGINELKNGAGQLVANNGELSDGLVDLKSGTDALKNGANILANKTSEILDGTDSLTNGIITLKSGTKELKVKTSDIDKQIMDGIETELENFTGKNYEGGSFVSPLNTKVDAVQFVIKTDGITIADVPKMETTEVKMSFWDKIKGLF